MTIRLLTSYEEKSNSMEQIGRDQHYLELSNNNQTTDIL